ncbi:MAG TPA: hypothetical protein VMU09_11350 [Acidimicrobiales bacterium]|nr:hypothetical protein [Acidimicrobiales bacterium]
MEYQPELPWDEAPARRATRRTPAAPKADRGRRPARTAKAADKAGRRPKDDDSGSAKPAARPGGAGRGGQTGRGVGRRSGVEAAGAPAFVVDEPWRLDESTRQVGRRGLAQARAALARAAASNGHAA